MAEMKENHSTDSKEKLNAYQILATGFTTNLKTIPTVGLCREEVH